MNRGIDLSRVAERHITLHAEIARLRNERRRILSMLRLALARLEHLDCDGGGGPCDVAAKVRRLLATLES